MDDTPCRCASAFRISWASARRESRHGGPLRYGRGSEEAAYDRSSLDRSPFRTATVRERAATRREHLIS